MTSSCWSGTLILEMKEFELAVQIGGGNTSLALVRPWLQSSGKILSKTKPTKAKPKPSVSTIFPSCHGWHVMLKLFACVSKGMDFPLCFLFFQVKE